MPQPSFAMTVESVFHDPDQVLPSSGNPTVPTSLFPSVMEAKGDMDMAAAPSTGHFGPYDYVVFGAMLLVSSLIGLYYRLSGGKQSTASEYLMGDRDRSELPVAFSLMASFMSAITLLGVSQVNISNQGPVLVLSAWCKICPYLLKNISRFSRLK